MKVAVVAHSGKTLGGGLPELRRALRAADVNHPLWCEVPKAKKAPAQVRRALKAGAAEELDYRLLLVRVEAQTLPRRPVRERVVERIGAGVGRKGIDHARAPGARW